MSRRDEIRKRILAKIRAGRPDAQISDDDLDMLVNEQLEYEARAMDAVRDSLLSSGFSRVTIG